jgi:hypothetical protein
VSYLAPLRLHFAGRFQADVSTVNNDPVHFDNATFKSEYQLLQKDRVSIPPTADEMRGWWNPKGSADWRFVGCAVTSGSYADGSPVGQDDPVLELLVADSDRQAPAKLVDLDPEQQMVSTIWGFEVRLCDRDGATRVRGKFAPAAFIDIWDRAPGTGGDAVASAAYQSVLTELEWGDIRKSRWLSELHEAATEGLLSIRFNVDGFNGDYTSPDFSYGRVVGTIGAASAAEPRHFVAGRQFMAVPAPNAVMFSPVGAINFCTAVVDEPRSRIIVDLGNALPTNGPAGPLADHGDLTLGYLTQPGIPASFSTLGTIDYLAEGWYEQSAGIAEVPLDTKQLKAIGDSQLALTLGYWTGMTVESPGGLYVRADQFVYRLDPGDTVDVRLFAIRYGRPYAGAQIVAAEDPSGLQGPPTQIAGEAQWPSVGETPGQAPCLGVRVCLPRTSSEPDSEWLMPFPVTLPPTDVDGTVMLPISASRPGNPRGYIDGQVYGVRPELVDQVGQPQAFFGQTAYPVDPWNFISLLVYDQFTPDEPAVTWWGSLQPIFQQYANLYPVMANFLDLSEYSSVCEHTELLQLAFGLDAENPNSMPATRDLSRSRRTAILKWLDTPGPDGKPLQGTPPPAPSTRPDGEAERPQTSTTAKAPPPGGKAAAAARRLVIPGALPPRGSP